MRITTHNEYVTRLTLLTLFFRTNLSQICVFHIFSNLYPYMHRIIYNSYIVICKTIQLLTPAVPLFFGGGGF